MKPQEMIKTFSERYPFVGPSFWMVSVQYYIIQLVVAMAWTIGYSLQHNTISDLGNTACGNYGDRWVCSPLHGLMNGSFIVLGLTMVLGALLIYQEFRRTDLSAIGFGAMAAAGTGTLVVGFFPENTVNNLHILGAALPFLVGNAGMVLLGSVLDVPKALRLYTVISGVVSLLALGLFVMHTYLGLGIGGMERIVAYPQTIWLIVFGIYISSNHIRSARS